MRGVDSVDSTGYEWGREKAGLGGPGTWSLQQREGVWKRQQPPCLEPGRGSDHIQAPAGLRLPFIFTKGWILPTTTRERLCGRCWREPRRTLGRESLGIHCRIFLLHAGSLLVRSGGRGWRGQERGAVTAGRGMR